MATMIVNKLNRQLNMGLPLNTCHTYIDVASQGSSSSARSSTKPTRAAHSEFKEDIVIVGQVVYPGISTMQKVYGKCSSTNAYLFSNNYYRSNLDSIFDY